MSTQHGDGREYQERALATIYNGHTAVAVAGTQVPLAAASTIVVSVTIKALHANTGMIYVGNAAVSAATGYVLDAGEEVSLDINDLNTVYIDADVGTEGVSYIAVI